VCVREGDREREKEDVLCEIHCVWGVGEGERESESERERRDVLFCLYLDVFCKGIEIEIEGIEIEDTSR